MQATFCIHNSVSIAQFYPGSDSLRLLTGETCLTGFYKVKGGSGIGIDRWGEWGVRVERAGRDWRSRVVRLSIIISPVSREGENNSIQEMVQNWLGLLRNIDGRRDFFVLRIKAEEKVSAGPVLDLIAAASSLPPSLPPCLVWPGPTIQLFITGLGTLTVILLCLCLYKEMINKGNFWQTFVIFVT